MNTIHLSRSISSFSMLYFIFIFSPPAYISFYLCLSIHLFNSSYPIFSSLFYVIWRFGNTGPYKDRLAYDVIISGIGGLLGITGSEGGEPTKVLTSGIYQLYISLIDSYLSIDLLYTSIFILSSISLSLYTISVPTVLMWFSIIFPNPYIDLCIFLCIYLYICLSISIYISI